MKSNVNENILRDKNLLSRIVIKFNDSLQITTEDENEVNNFFNKSGLFPWQKLCKLFPGLLVQKLFTSLRTQEIIELVRKAGESDSDWHPPNFANYFVIKNFPLSKAEKLIGLLLDL